MIALYALIWCAAYLAATYVTLTLFDLYHNAH